MDVRIVLFSIIILVVFLSLIIGGVVLLTVLLSRKKRRGNESAINYDPKDDYKSEKKSNMKKLQVYLATFMGLASALLLVGVVYLAFIFPKTVKVWAEEGIAISVVQQNLVNLSNLCTSLGIIIMPTLLLVVIGCAVWAIFAGMGNKKETANNSKRKEENMNNNEGNPSKDEKKEILEMLAKKEISKEEAEKKLSELGSPVEDQQQIQSDSKGNKNIGCLIVIILGVLLIPVILLILLSLLCIA